MGVTVLFSAARQVRGPQRNSFDRNIRIARAARQSYVTCMSTNAILSEEEAMKRNSQQDPARRWQAVVDRDSSLDGTFVFGVSSTGLLRPPACPGTRPPRPSVSM